MIGIIIYSLKPVIKKDTKNNTEILMDTLLNLEEAHAEQS
jgi:hypothetical protein